MDAVDYILHGLEAELELERELGVREIEIDRALLKVESPAAAPVAAPVAPVVPPVRPAAPERAPVSAPVAPVVPPVRPAAPERAPVSAPAASVPSDASAGLFDFVFLHHAALADVSEKMYRDIVAWMGKTPETAPLVWDGRVPRARIYVVFGMLALRKWMPGLAAAPGQWIKTPRGCDALVTYSPDYVTRFARKGETAAVQNLKKQMLVSLKGVLQRTRSAAAK